MKVEECVGYREGVGDGLVVKRYPVVLMANEAIVDLMQNGSRVSQAGEEKPRKQFRSLTIADLPFFTDLFTLLNK